MLHYSGKFPSLKRIYSGYGGKFLQEHLYIKLKVGVFPRGYIQPKLYPPLCQVSCTKNWTKVYANLVCVIRMLAPSGAAPAPPRHVGAPHVSPGPCPLFANMLKYFLLWQKSICAYASLSFLTLNLKGYNFIINLLNF